MEINSFVGTSLGHGTNIAGDKGYDEAMRVIREAGMRAISEEALVIEVEDKPGALAEVAKRFADGEINIRSLHILRRVGGRIHVSLVVEDQEEAIGVVGDLILRVDGEPI